MNYAPLQRRVGGGCPMWTYGHMPRHTGGTWTCYARKRTQGPGGLRHLHASTSPPWPYVPAAPVLRGLPAQMRRLASANARSSATWGGGRPALMGTRTRVMKTAAQRLETRGVRWQCRGSESRQAADPRAALGGKRPPARPCASTPPGLAAKDARISAGGPAPAARPSAGVVPSAVTCSSRSRPPQRRGAERPLGKARPPVSKGQGHSTTVATPWSRTRPQTDQHPLAAVVLTL
jgi:hypothetical protein